MSTYNFNAKDGRLKLKEDQVQQLVHCGVVGSNLSANSLHLTLLEFE
jgi:hypothetical protein